MAEKISIQNVAQAAQEYSCNFGANKNLYRITPSLQDGIKPGRRRLYYAWWELEKRPQNVSSETLKRLKFHKGGIIASNAMKYHPHSDNANADILGRDGQPWSNNVMCIIPQGSYGNMRGDSVASGRYIEAKMSPYMIDCFFSDFDKYCVPMKLSYTGDSWEPEYLPAKYPHMLFNPQFSGIGWGMAANIPSFNVTEVLKATIKLLKDPKAKVMLIPDSPTGADIVDNGNFDKINKVGEGTLVMQATSSIDYTNNIISFTTLPYQSTSGSVILKIIDLKKNKKMFDDIAEIKDSSKNGVVDLRVYLKNDANPEKMLEKLYKKNVGLRQSYPVGITYIDDYKSYTKGVKGYLLEWIEYRKDLVRSMFNNSLQQLQEKQHMNEVLLMVFNSTNAEDTLKICRTSNSKKETVDKLMKKYKITSLQANTIAEMRLYNFNKDSYQRFKDDAVKLKNDIKYTLDVLDHDEKIDDFIIAQLEDGIKKYGGPRRSKVITLDTPQDDIPDTMHLVGISETGWIKKVSNDNQSIGPVGKTNSNISVIQVNNRESILVVDSGGTMTKIDVNDIQDMNFEDEGVDTSRFFKTHGSIVASMELPSKKMIETSDENKCIIFVTKDGYAKRTLLSDFKMIKDNVTAIGLNKGDAVVTALFTTDTTVKDFVIYTNKGNGIRMSISNIPISGKNAKGNRQVNLGDDEFVVGANKINPDKKRLVYVTSSGKIKCTELKYFPVTDRKDGVLSLITLDKNETLVGVASVTKKDVVMVYRKIGEPIQINMSDVEPSSRIAKAEKMIKTPKGDSVIAFKVFSNK